MAEENKDEQAKYDRQIRLWGVHGQRILMTSKICLLGSGPSGTETLKNLILPGVGYFTVVDDHKVESRDLGNNFFVTEDDIGKNKSEAVVEWLNELNPDVKGKAEVQSPQSLIENNPKFFADFDLIIAQDITDKYLRILGDICKTEHKSLVSIRSSGFVGSVRIYNAVHTIIEGKAERDLDGYRLFSPFAELKEYANNIDFASLDDFQHRHIPYFAILIQGLAEWKKSHNGTLPQNFKEKQEFSQFIKHKSRNFYEEENFEEAVKFSHKALINPANLPANVEKIFSSSFVENINEKSNNFWIKSAALKKFYEANKALPVRSTIPDLTSDTTNYLNLKKAYEKKAEADRKELAHFIQEIKKDSDISDDELKTFCDNVYNIDYIAYRSIAEEFDTPLPLECFESDSFKWHFALRANSIFYERNGRYANSKETNDLPQFIEILTNIQKSVEGVVAVEEENTKIAKEMLRYEGSQLHTIGALLGGVASQEAIKLLTHQFKPINHTYIYNGITSEGEVYEF